MVENIMVAKKIMHSIARAPPSKSLMAMKLDIISAYDQVHWTFHWKDLHHFGFLPCFIIQIQVCVLEPEFALIINGTPTNLFQPARGILLRLSNVPIFIYS